ncbi:MAG: dCTP deaminase [Geobacter sp.]|nr:MAG: dCTP deaminase [Geobacter sp.]
MQLLNKKDIEVSLASSHPNTLFIDPLLDQEQIGNVTVDLRLGYDFFVSILTRKPFIEVLATDPKNNRGIASFFQETRRDISDRFILYPNQVVLTTTLEYVSLPSNVYADVLTRSSYTRLGIHLNTMIQPGFRGCVPLELVNHGNNAIELVVGSKICQVRLFKLAEESPYHESSDSRKYFGDVRPVLSKAESDKDLDILSKIQTAKP